jgi:hypothetical protein
LPRLLHQELQFFSASLADGTLVGLTPGHSSPNTDADADKDADGSKEKISSLRIHRSALRRLQLLEMLVCTAYSTFPIPKAIAAFTAHGTVHSVVQLLRQTHVINSRNTDINTNAIIANATSSALPLSDIEKIEVVAASSFPSSPLSAEQSPQHASASFPSSSSSSSSSAFSTQQSQIQSHSKAVRQPWSYPLSESTPAPSFFTHSDSSNDALAPFAKTTSNWSPPSVRKTLQVRLCTNFVLISLCFRVNFEHLSTALHVPYNNVA